MNILKNSDNQIRSGWKIAMVYVSYFILTIILTTLVTFIYSIIYLAINPQYMNNPGELAQRISEEFSSFSSGIGTIIKCIDCLSMIFCVILFWKLLDKKKVNELGFTNIKHSYKDLIFGLILGALSFTIIAATLVLTGSVEMTNVLSKPAFSMNLILELLMFVLVGINEELFCRGYCITVLKQSKRAWVPVIVSSIIFSLMHSLNAGISMLAYINLFLYAITMGYIFIKIKNIWMGIGYHITWNYFQGDIFGFLVSGNETNSLYTLKSSAPDILNGGSFGPEGGLVVTIVLIISIFCIYKFLPYRDSEKAK